MKKEEEDFMAHLLVDSLLDFTILLAQKRVCYIEFLIIIILHLEKDSILALSLAKDQIYRKKSIFIT
jgi:hypothetical protein